MGYLNGPIGCGMVLLALLHLGVPGRPYLLISMYLCGAALAFITLAPCVSQRAARFLAVCATACMFFFFAGFIHTAPHLGAEWYAVNLPSLGQLVSAFAMIPVLSEYSCLMKADCAKAINGRKAKGFFSVSG